MLTHQELLNHFKDFYKSDKLLTIFTLGGGGGFSKIIETPGMSKYMKGLITIYDSKMLIEMFPNLDINKIVTLSNTKHMGEQSKEIGTNVIIVNCALTTDRYRHGPNLAHYYLRYENEVAIGTIHLTKKPNSSFHLFYENVLEKRLEEDDLVCTTVLDQYISLMRSVNE